MPSIINIIEVKYMTCSAIWGLLDKGNDLRASHELLNTKRVI